MKADSIVRWLVYPLIVVIGVMLWTNQNPIDIAAMIGAAGGVALVGLVLIVQEWFAKRKQTVK